MASAQESREACLAIIDALECGIVASLSGSAARVYLIILAAHEFNGAKLSIHELAERSGVSRRSIKRAISSLVARKLIKRDANPTRATIYKAPAILAARAKLAAVVGRGNLGPGDLHAA